MTPSITCLLCGLESHHLMDVLHKYCGHCKVFHADVPPGGRSMEYSDEELLEIVKELDMLATGLTDRAINFIEDLLTNPPAKLSSRQRDWIVALKETHLA